MRIGGILMVLAVAAGVCAGGEANESSLVRVGGKGRLVYRAYTDKGDVIPDFSNFGYRGGGVWQSKGKAVAPHSLYLRKLKDRLGAEAVENISSDRKKQR